MNLMLLPGFGQNRQGIAVCYAPDLPVKCFSLWNWQVQGIYCDSFANFDTGLKCSLSGRCRAVRSDIRAFPIRGGPSRGQKNQQQHFAAAPSPAQGYMPAGAWQEIASGQRAKATAMPAKPAPDWSLTGTLRNS